MSMALLLSLVACGSKPGETTAAAQESESTTPTEESSTTVPEEIGFRTQLQAGNVLVVYYSASDNTQRLAEDIAKTLDGV